MDFAERRRRECHVGASDLDRRKVDADDFERMNRVAGVPLEQYRNLDPTMLPVRIWRLISSFTTPRALRSALSTPVAYGTRMPAACFSK
jgi:hypothetical protein